MRQQQREQEARLRAELIVQVRSGALTAAAAARRLGVSRKTYYKWERRALAGMMGALGQRSGGRPPVPVDEEKARLAREIAQLRRKLLLAEQRLAIQELMRQESAAGGGERSGGTKKKGRGSGDDR
jgi:transposase-like protein